MCFFHRELTNRVTDEAEIQEELEQRVGDER